MAKKTELNYSDPKLLIGREVIIGLQGGTNLAGQIRYINEDTFVLVSEPTSALDIETRVVHYVVNASRVDFIQFKTDRE